MGVSGSKGQKLFVSVLQRLLSERGLHVKESSAIEFYQFLIKVSPWFPEEGGLNLQDWKRVGREMKRYAAEHGTDSIPKQAYPIWLQLREILTEQSDLVLLSAEAKSVTEEELEEGLTGLLSTSSQEKTYGTRGTAYAEIDTEVDKLSEHIYDEPYEEKEKANKNEEKDHVRKVKKVVQRKEISEGKRKEKDQKAFLATDWNDDDLSPEDWDDLEEQAAHYHDDDELILPVKRKVVKKKPQALRRKPLPPVGFAGAMAEAREKGDLTFTFPVVFMGESDDDDTPVWEPLPLKTLKELQLAVKTMGPSAPYTLQVVDMVASQWLTPSDWHQTARATLSPGDYVLWRTEYEEKSKETVQKAAGKRKGKVSLDMLLGTGQFLSPSSQIKLSKDVLKDVTTNAVLAWRAIPPPGVKKTVLAGLKQGNKESYETFISRLEEAVYRMMPRGEGSDILIKQLAWKNANSLCQDLIRPIRKTGTIQDYIRACLDASPAVVQGMAYAAAMRGQKYSTFVKQTYGGGKGGQGSEGPVCFSCGKTRHIKKDCKEEKGSKRAPSGLCPRCKKGYHWKSECKSKFDKDGNPLPPLETNTENSKNL